MTTAGGPGTVHSTLHCVVGVIILGAKTKSSLCLGLLLKDIVNKLSLKPEIPSTKSDEMVNLKKIIFCQT